MAKIISEILVANCFLKLRDDGILHAHIIKKNTEEFKFKEIIEKSGEILNYNPAPLLITYDDNVFPSFKYGDSWAKKETSFQFSLADAFVTHSLSLKIIGNMFLKYNKPLRPTKLFKNETEAIEWLLTFI